MGEAANKMNRDDAHKRVVELRDEITRKREQLSIELEELRKRRSQAIVRGKETAKMAAGAAVALYLVGSLMNAIMDLFRKDEEIHDDEQLVTASTTQKVAKKEARTSALLSAVTTLAVNEIRKAAMEYAKRELRTRLNRSHERVAARYADQSISTNGDRRTDIA